MVRRQHFIRYASLSVLALSFLFMGACTHVYQQPIHNISLHSTGDKINIPVRLEITDDLRNAKWEKHYMGDTFVMPLGENLVHHSTNLVRAVFSEVAAPGAGGEPRYVLTPKVVFVEQSFGVSAFSEAKLSIGMEWKLAKSTGEPVWVETVRGEGTGKAGNAFTGKEKMKERAEQALRNLFENSQRAMLTSNLLRNLK